MATETPEDVKAMAEAHADAMGKTGTRNFWIDTVNDYLAGWAAGVAYERGRAERAAGTGTPLRSPAWHAYNAETPKAPLAPPPGTPAAPPAVTLAGLIEAGNAMADEFDEQSKSSIGNRSQREKSIVIRWRELAALLAAPENPNFVTGLSVVGGTSQARGGHP
jgi:hypothetical protein